MKEEEAKTKWCPMSRSGVMFSANRCDTGRITDADKCITTNCMLWKWYTECPNRLYSKTEGYCGLGGK